MKNKHNVKNARVVRHMRIRKKLSGDEIRPRVSVYRSNQHIYAQVIDDINSKTLDDHGYKK